MAENVQRVALHPLDQFRAFLAMREKGQPEEDIAAAFFVPVNVVKQRLRLAAVAPSLLDLYAEDGITLEQLMAFTVTHDHARQAQVWEMVSPVPSFPVPYRPSALSARGARAHRKPVTAETAPL